MGTYQDQYYKGIPTENIRISKGQFWIDGPVKEPGVLEADQYRNWFILLIRTKILV